MRCFPLLSFASLDFLPCWHKHASISVWNCLGLWIVVALLVSFPSLPLSLILCLSLWSCFWRQVNLIAIALNGSSTLKRCLLLVVFVDSRSCRRWEWEWDGEGAGEEAEVALRQHTRLPPSPIYDSPLPQKGKEQRGPGAAVSWQFGLWFDECAFECTQKGTTSGPLLAELTYHNWTYFSLRSPSLSLSHSVCPCLSFI